MKTTRHFLWLLGSAAACNALVGNQSGDSLSFDDREDAASSSSSSSSSSTSSSGSGGLPDATPPGDASSSSSSSGAPVACTCAVAGTFCGFCDVEPTSIAEDLTSLAATSDRLFGLRDVDRTLQAYPLDPITSLPGAVVSSVEMFNRIVGATPPFGTTASNYFYGILGLHGSNDFSICTVSNATVCSPRGLDDGNPLSFVSAPQGAMVLASKPSGGFQFHVLAQNALVSWDDFVLPADTEIAFTTNATRAFWREVGVSAVNVSPLMDFSLTQQVLGPAVPDPRELAANDAELFLAPCANAAICAFSLPLSASAVELRSVLPSQGDGALGVTELHADGNVLYFNLSGAAQRCLASNCTPEPIGASDSQAHELRAVAHNQRDTYLQIGERTYRTQRAPLRPDP